LKPPKFRGRWMEVDGAKGPVEAPHVIVEGGLDVQLAVARPWNP
jgi:hypothetical protein